MTTAVYSGSFDILTHGHLDIIKKTKSMFSNVSVLIANNSKKKYVFTASERYNNLFLWKSITGIDINITVWSDQLIVDFNDWKTDRVLIRGIRNTTDMIEEMQLADINKEIGGIDTVFIPCSNELRNVSSSLVKELLSYKKDISKYVPDYVEEALRRKGL